MSYTERLHPIGHRIKPGSPTVLEHLDFVNLFCTMEYEGSVKEVIEKLNCTTDIDSIKTNFWESSRLIRFIVDNAPAESNSRINLINEATNLIAEHYSGYEYRDRLNRIKRKIGSIGLYNSDKIRQLFRSETVESSLLNGSIAVSRHLAKIATKPVLFIPVCHSGVPTGVQTLLHYRSTFPESTLYPIKYSIVSNDDKVPHISNTEKDYLTKMSKDRTVVVIDDIAASGLTITGVMKKLDSFMPSDSQIIGIANSDTRPVGRYCDQGRYWEKTLKNRDNPNIKDDQFSKIKNNISNTIRRVL